MSHFFLIQGFFSGKKGDKAYNKMTFQEKMYKAKMQNIWYIKKTCYVVKLLSGISGTILRISGTIPRISGTKKIVDPQKALYRRMMTVEPLPRSLNLKKDYIPGKKRHNLAEPVFFPFVLFFLHTLE